MPSCSVVVCKNTSKKVNYEKDGISFHVFPKDPKIKEKWIHATGRGPNWFPTKNSTICSIHFAATCMQPLKKVRRLFEWAVPTLKLYTKLMNYMEPSTSKMSGDSELDISKPQIETDLLKSFEKSNTLNDVEPSTSKISVDSESTLILISNQQIESDSQKTCEQSNTLEHSEDPDKKLINETPRKRKLRRIISTQEELIKKQKSQIKRLQKNTSRYKKKIADLKTILDSLKGKNYIGGDHVTQSV